MATTRQQKHDTQVFGTVDGKFYWSCGECQASGKPVESEEAAQKGAEAHATGK